MTTSNDSIHSQITEIETMLDDTVSGLNSGPTRDAMKLVVPMMKDLCRVMHQITTPGWVPSAPTPISESDLRARVEAGTASSAEILDWMDRSKA